MKRLNSASRIGILCTAVALAFWAGRATGPAPAAEQRPADKRVSLSSPRAQVSTRGDGNEANGPRRDSRAAGREVVTTALQLRDFFKHSDGDYEKGQALAEATLSKMSRDQLSHLVADLAKAQATNPGYSYALEISAACSRWAAVDPEAALDFILSAKQASFREAAVTKVLTGIARTDPDLARQKLESIQDPQLRSQARSGLMQALATAQPDAWAAMLKEDPSAARYMSLSNIASEWAVDDPAAAARRLQQLPQNLQEDATESVAKVWAAKDSAAATAWANSLADPSLRDQALMGIAGSIAATNPDRALAVVAALSPELRSSGINSVFETLADQDFDSAISRATSLPNIEDKNTAFESILSEDRYTTAAQLSALVGKLPDDSVREEALDQLGGKLASVSASETTRILQSYPEDERATLQAKMAESMAATDPARAMEIYASLPVEKRGTSTFERIVRNLSNTDPDAAHTAVQNADIPENQRQQLFDKLDRKIADE